MSGKIAGIVTLAITGVLLYAGSNVEIGANRTAPHQADYQQRLACAAVTTCNDPTGLAK